MRKRIFIIVLCVSFGILTCESEREQLSSVQNEEYALNFFVDSLLFQKQIFPFEKKDWDSAQLILPPSLYFDSLMYLKEGLFTGYNIYADSVLIRLSEPFMSDAEIEFSSDSELNRTHRILKKNYDSLKNNKDLKVIALPQIVQLSTLKDFKSKNPENSLFLEVNKGLKNESDSTFIQIRVLKFFNSTYDYYDCYLVVNDHEVVDWFFN